MLAELAPRTFPIAHLMIVLSMVIQGCFTIIEEHDLDDGDYPEVDSAFLSSPWIDSNDSWWSCSYSPYDDAFFFEFQAVVDDPEGWYSVDEVTIYFFASGSPNILDSFAMNHEGGDLWGGTVWEQDSFLFCGDPIDVIIEARNFSGGSYLLSIEY